MINFKKFNIMTLAKGGEGPDPKSTPLGAPLLFNIFHEHGNFVGFLFYYRIDPNDYNLFITLAR